MFQDRVGVRARGDAKGRDGLQLWKGLHHHQSTTVAQDEMRAFSVEGRDDVMGLLVDRHHGVFPVLIDDHGGMFQRTDQEVGGVPGMELDLQDRRLNAGDSRATTTGGGVPDADGVVGGRGSDQIGLLRPRDGVDRRPIRTDDLGDATGQEIPDHQTTVRTAHSEHRT